MSRTIMSDPSKKEIDVPQPLNYRGLDPQVAEQFRFRRENMHATIGGVVAMFVTLGLDIHIFVVKPHSLRGAVIVAVIVYGTLSAIAFYRYRRYRSTMFAQGVLLAIGIALLLHGVCYLITRS